MTNPYSNYSAQQFPPAPQPPAPKKRTGLKIGLGVLGGVVALGLLGSALGGEEDESYAAPTTRQVPITSAAAYTAPVAVPTTRTAPPKKNPLTTNGTWLIGKDIQPGVYAVTPVREAGVFDSETGYWELCSDFACKIGEGMIANEFLTGPGYVEIPATAHSIKLDDVELAPVG